MWTAVASDAAGAAVDSSRRSAVDRPRYTVVSVMAAAAAAAAMLTVSVDALVVRNRTMEYPKSDTEYRIQDDIVIGQGGLVVIHPGVTLFFEPGMGITVQEGGVLIANGTSDDPILLTSRGDPLTAFSTIEQRQWPDIRLVDGDGGPHEGRLQILYRQRWMSVCTNSRNWTLEDLSVACRQLGFSGGSIYRWFDKYNHTDQFSLQAPGCSGSENRLQACSGWNTRLVGSGICDYHSDVGIQCSQKLGPATASNWRGLSFDGARASRRKRLQNRVDRYISKSVLRNVTVRHAGRDQQGLATPAVHVVSGCPPVIIGLTVEGSAYTGLNITAPDDYFLLADVNLVNNRGKLSNYPLH